MKDFEDQDVPVVQYDPDTLVKLANAYEVLEEAQAESIRAQQEAIQQAANEHAEHISRCAAIYHSLRAEAHAMGFTMAQIDRQLGLDIE